MAFSPASFKTKLAAAGGVARPSLYKVTINESLGANSLSETEVLLVKAANMPASNIAPLTVNYAGRALKWQGFRTYDIWNVTVINDENMQARQNIMEWMVGISGQLRGNRASTIGGRFGTTAEGDATVTQI